MLAANGSWVDKLKTTHNSSDQIQALMTLDTSEVDGDGTWSQILEMQDLSEDLGSWSDMSREHKEVPGIHNGTNKAEYT